MYFVFLKNLFILNPCHFLIFQITNLPNFSLLPHPPLTYGWKETPSINSINHTLFLSVSLYVIMQDFFRRSLAFRTPPQDHHDPDNPNQESNYCSSINPLTSTLVDKFNSCVRKSRIFSKPTSPSSPPMPPPIRYRKGELIGCGAFGHVYMGMNFDSGELLAIKQVAFLLILSGFCLF